MFEVESSLRNHIYRKILDGIHYFRSQGEILVNSFGDLLNNYQYIVWGLADHYM